MSGVALVVLGAIIGAAASGGVQAWLGWRERKLERKVAARAILGDLYVSGSMFELILKRDQWPDRLELDAPLSTWREFRGAFAASVGVWEWALVDRFYASLARTGLMIDLGARLTDQDRSIVQELQAMLPEVQRIAAEHATASERERRRATEALSGDGRP